MPEFALALAFAYTLHMLATVIWFGGLLVMSVFLLPTLRITLPPSEFLILLEKLNRWANPISWLCLTVLTATGLFQMSASTHYMGFLTVNSPWAGAILVKHIAFLLIIVISAYESWSILPALERSLLTQRAQKQLPSILPTQLLDITNRLLLANLALGVIVLLLTAIARAA